MRRLTIVLTSSTILTACAGGSDATGVAPLALTQISVAPGGDTAVVSVTVTRPATVRLAYVPSGRADSSFLQEYVNSTRNLILRSLLYNQQYELRATATALGEAPVQSNRVTFITPAAPDPCDPTIAKSLTPVPVKFEYRPQPPDLAAIVEVTDLSSCDGSMPFANGLILSFDNGVSLWATIGYKPNWPYGSKPILFRAALYHPVGFIRWLRPDEFTLNGQHPTRTITNAPQPICVTWADPCPGTTTAVIFNLDASGKIDP